MQSFNIDTGTTEQFAKYVVNQSPEIVTTTDQRKIVEEIVRRDFPLLAFDELVKKLFYNTMTRICDRTVRQYYAGEVEWVQDPQLSLFAEGGQFEYPRFFLDDNRKRKESRSEPLASLQRRYSASFDLVSEKTETLRQALRSAEKTHNKWANLIGNMARFVQFVRLEGYDPEVMTIDEAKKIAENKDGRGAVHAFQEAKGTVRDLFV